MKRPDGTLIVTVQIFLTITPVCSSNGITEEVDKTKDTVNEYTKWMGKETTEK